MKLKNKKTGEIMDDAQYRNFSLIDGFGFRVDDKEYLYHSLAEFNEEWEDYNEPKSSWYIDLSCNDIKILCLPEEVSEKLKQIGNYFETKEEAEKAVEKLKAWKRLKDEGFRFRKQKTTHFHLGEIEYFLPDVHEKNDEYRDDLDLLFSGEDD